MLRGHFLAPRRTLLVSPLESLEDVDLAVGLGGAIFALAIESDLPRSTFHESSDAISRSRSAIPDGSAMSI